MALEPHQQPKYVKYSHLPNDVYKVISCYGGWVTYIDYNVGTPWSEPYSHPYLVEATEQEFFAILKKPPEQLGNPTG